MDGKINTVCIVDDDDIYQYTTTFEIKRTELVRKVIVFSNGKEAIDFFKIEQNSFDNLPDLIFLDINMPVMDGWQFLEEYLLLKASFPKNIEIYLVSSSVDHRDLQRAKKISILSGYIVKPITRDRLTEIFQHLLN